MSMDTADDAVVQACDQQDARVEVEIRQETPWAAASGAME